MASFNLAAAAAAHLGPDFLDAFQPAGPVAARDQTPGHLIARNDSSVPTVNLFLDNPIESLEYAASVIDACVDQTTYAIQCTDGIYGCGANAMVQTVTAGPSTLRYATSTVINDDSATLEENCQLQGTTQAVCTATAAQESGGEKVAFTTTITMSGTDYVRHDVAITAGAEKTENPSAECKPPASGASTKAVAMWGLVGVVGVASLLGF